MDIKKIIILSALFLSLLIIMIFFFRSGSKEKIKKAPNVIVTEAEDQSLQEPAIKIVKLFFLTERDSLLHPEEREIHSSLSIVDQMRQTIEELLKGSQNGAVSPFPADTKLRELFITPEGVVYVDFSRDIQDKHLSGSSAEIATVFSVVNSLAHNFELIKKVFILIDGGEVETLGGHIDLSRPFLPRFDLNAK
jgi:spore germination protein GerM